MHRHRHAAVLLPGAGPWLLGLVCGELAAARTGEGRRAGGRGGGGGDGGEKGRQGEGEEGRGRRGAGSEGGGKQDGGSGSGGRRRARASARRPGCLLPQLARAAGPAASTLGDASACESGARAPGRRPPGPGRQARRRRGAAAGRRRGPLGDKQPVHRARSGAPSAVRCPARGPCARGGPARLAAAGSRPRSRPPARLRPGACPERGQLVLQPARRQPAQPGRPAHPRRDTSRRRSVSRPPGRRSPRPPGDLGTVPPPTSHLGGVSVAR